MYMRYESYATPGKKLIIQISVKGLSLKGMCWERRKIGDLSQFRSLRSLTGSVLHYSYLEIRKWAGEAEEYSINHSKLRPEPKSFRNIGSHLETFIPIGGEGKIKGKKKNQKSKVDHAAGREKDAIMKQLFKCELFLKLPRIIEDLQEIFSISVN